MAALPVFPYRADIRDGYRETDTLSSEPEDD
jgi:hypothetical protein